MTAKFKHRLLGTSILILAGIIFLPDLLDGEKKVVKDDFKAIPDRPEFQHVQELKPFDDAAFAQKSEQVTAQTVSSETALDEEDKDAAKDALPSQQYAQVTTNTEDEAQSVRSTPTVTERQAPATGLQQAAWVVRVGSFSNSQNANALMLKLRQDGFATFTRSITNSNGQPLTSVFVGPETRREKLEQGLTKLQQLTGIERLVISNYQPTENN